MACTKCNTSNNTCGCKDTPVAVPFVPQCPPDPLFPDPNPCSETILDTCVKHRPNYTIFNALNALTLQGLEITPDTTLEQVYQMLSLNVWDAACPCPTDLHLSYLGTTAVVFNWSDVLSLGNTYRLEISTTSDFQGGTVSEIPDLTGGSLTVQNLTAGTTYYAKLVSKCNGDDGSTTATVAFTTNS
jgi:hypothetical protein